MTRRHALLLAALLLAAGLLIFGDRGSDSEPALPLARSTRNGGAGPAATAMAVEAPGAAAAVATASVPIAELLPRASYIGNTGTKPRGAPAFGAQSWDPPPPPVVVVAAPPPSAPPLPFSYVGRQLVDGQTDVFLAQGDRIFVARGKTAIDANYRIDSITPGSVNFTYLPLNQAQQLSIGAPD
jgi:hypothetical protein